MKKMFTGIEEVFGKDTQEIVAVIKRGKDYFVYLKDGWILEFPVKRLRPIRHKKKK